jgi:hypothetical protein
MTLYSRPIRFQKFNKNPVWSDPSCFQQKRDWPHQEHYVLCNGPLETRLLLSLLCPFAKAVWDVLDWENFVMQWPQQDPTSIVEWWE